MSFLCLPVGVGESSLLIYLRLIDRRAAQYKSTAEATLDAARVILRQCADSKTVKRVIHTGTISTCSPLKEDSTGFKDAVDESCWTPLDVDYPHRNLPFHVRMKFC